MRSELVAREQLSSIHLEAMYRLLSTHFDGTDEHQFQHDLNNKNWVVLILDEEEQVRGFTTLDFNPTRWQGDLIWVVYSGDTIMDPSHWNSPILARSWIRSVLELQTLHGCERSWWLLLSSGFRTYRFLPVFWKRFVPHFEHSRQDLNDLRDALATQRFGRRFDARTGIVRFDQPQRLKPHLQSVPHKRKKNDHVAHFLKLNTGHGDGDELVCLTEIHPSNLTAAGRRMTRQSVPAQTAT